MKLKTKLLTTLSVAILLVTIEFPANAICIGCGCGAAFRSCVENGTNACPTEYNDLMTGQLITPTLPQRVSCCTVGYRNCHKGFGIGTLWWGGLPSAPGTSGYVDLPPTNQTEGIFVAFSINGGVLGSHDGGQYIKPLHLLTSEELNQLTPYQPVINKYLNGVPLTQADLNLIDGI